MRFVKINAILIALAIIANIGIALFWPHVASLAAISPATLQFTYPPAPKVDTSKSSPFSYAKAYIVVDTATNTVLATKNPHLKIYPASVTKLATVITALNLYPLDEVVTVKNPYNDGKIMDLQVGEKITVRSLVSGLLIYSANDSAFNLADHYQAGTTGFVIKMNDMVKNLNLTGTHFVNFDGIHNDEHFSTVYDLAQIARLAIKNQLVRQLADTQNLTVTDVDHTITHTLTTTNELLGVIPEVQGLKTGWTPEAGGSFVCLYYLNGHQIISVVAQSDDRFGDTKKLINWTKSAVTWQPYSVDDTMASVTAGS